MQTDAFRAVGRTGGERHLPTLGGPQGGGCCNPRQGVADLQSRGFGMGKPGRLQPAEQQRHKFGRQGELAVGRLPAAGQQHQGP